MSKKDISLICISIAFFGFICFCLGSNIREWNIYDKLQILWNSEDVGNTDTYISNILNHACEIMKNDKSARLGMAFLTAKNTYTFIDDGAYGSMLVGWVDHEGNITHGNFMKVEE